MPSLIPVLPVKGLFPDTGWRTHTIEYGKQLIETRFTVSGLEGAVRSSRAALEDFLDHILDESIWRHSPAFGDSDQSCLSSGVNGTVTVMAISNLYRANAGSNESPSTRLPPPLPVHPPLPACRRYPPADIAGGAA